MSEETIKVQRTESYQVYPENKHIDPVPFFSQPDACQTKLFQHRMLSFPLRNIVILKIKDPLRKALVAGKNFPRLIMVFFWIVVSAWRIRKYVGKVTKHNSVYRNTHVLLDFTETIKSCYHQSGRTDMVLSALEIGAAEIEHDPVYAFIGFKLANYIIEQAKCGNWITDEMPIPVDLAKHWNE